MMTVSSANLKGLKRIGRELKLKGFSTMKRDDLIDAICEAMEDNEEVTTVVNGLLEQIEAETPEKTTSCPSLGITELTFNGKTQSIAAWADEVGLARPALYDRINRHGWSVEEALTIPKGGRRKKPEVETTESESEESDE
jgi:hypothetical protein